MSKMNVKSLWHARCPSCRGGVLKLQGFVLTEDGKEVIFCVCTKCEDPVTYDIGAVLSKMYEPDTPDKGNGQ